MPRTKFPPSPGRKTRMYATAEHMQLAIDRYFESCLERTWVTKLNPHTGEEYLAEQVEQVRPYTITGLAVALGFESREALLYYEDISPDYLRTIRKAKLKCQMHAEESLWRKNQVAGIIFNLKNNYGWQDKIVNENVDVTSQATNDEKAEQARKKLLELANNK